MEKKPIEISQSSLLSLKAEILRKQQEVKESKLKARFQPTIKKKSLIKNPGVDERNSRDEFNSEIDADVLKQSRIALEAKSKLYDKLSKTVISEEDEGLYLVQFNKKPQEITPQNENLPTIDENLEENGNNYDDEQNIDPSDEWVEYTDCLGRSRMCLRKDLPFIESKDKQLSSFLPLEKQQNVNPAVVEMDEFFQRREQMRQQWEAQERNLMNKDNIHYQDVLFNEARSHGVGYFNFSHNEEERIKQQEELKKIRADTKTKQQEIQILKQHRDAEKAARIRAAKNRQRARQGLPPLEDEPEPMPVPEVVEEKPVEKSEEERLKEKELEMLRSKHVRPWDIGKKDLQHEPKSQEEWVKAKRRERPKEFAPPSVYGSHSQQQQRRRQQQRSSSSSSEDDNPREKTSTTYGFSSRQTRSPSPLEDNFEHKNSLHFTSKKQSKNQWKDHYSDESGHVNPYKRSHEIEESSSKIPKLNEEAPPPPIISKPSPKTLDETSSDSSSSTNVIYNPFASSNEFVPTDIVNEVDDTPASPEQRSDPIYDPFEAEIEDHRIHKRYAEIPPPPTMEYYGTAGNSSRHQAKKPLSEIQASIEAGLKFLRKQSERKHAKTENVGFFD